MRAKLALLSGLERAAAGARRIGLGAIVDRVAPTVARPFERFSLEVGDVTLAGTELAHLHYVRELREQGRERTFVRLLAEAVPRGGIVLEGGAHLGFVTVHAARAAGPDGRVFVFEPNRSVHDSLLANLEANGVASRVEVFPQALGAAAGAGKLSISADTSSLFGSASDEPSEEVEIVRADQVVTAHVDVVKLDVEGSETAALRGLAGFFAGARPPRVLFVECFPALLVQAGSSRDELLALLHMYGYDVEWIDEPHGRTAPLSQRWDGDYVNFRCLRRS